MVAGTGTGRGGTAYGFAAKAPFELDVVPPSFARAKTHSVAALLCGFHATPIPPAEWRPQCLDLPARKITIAIRFGPFGIEQALETLNGESGHIHPSVLQNVQASQPCPQQILAHTMFPSQLPYNQFACRQWLPRQIPFNHDRSSDISA